MNILPRRLLCFLSLICIYAQDTMPPELLHKKPFVLDTTHTAVANFLHDPRLQCPLHINQKKLSIAIIQPSVMEKMIQPSEKKPWSFYKNILITPQRIENGKLYMQDQAKALRKMYRRYNVPSAIVTAIIGIETSYGKNTGNYRVLDTLSTLAFYYPRRADYFQSELIAYLNVSCTLSDEQRDLQGSYAGAFGIPQFMPSSNILYARSLYGTKPDITTSHHDAIASVGNYLLIKGKWQTGAPIIKKLSSMQLKKLPQTILKDPENMHPIQTLPCTKMHCAKNARAVWCPSTEDGCYWLYPNFYSILTYNLSKNYALAVALLAQHIS